MLDGVLAALLRSVASDRWFCQFAFLRLTVAMDLVRIRQSSSVSRMRSLMRFAGMSSVRAMTLSQYRVSRSSFRERASL